MSSEATLCPYCGAYKPRNCELEEEAGFCPWEESGEYEEMLKECDDEQ